MTGSILIFILSAIFLGSFGNIFGRSLKTLNPFLIIFSFFIFMLPCLIVIDGLESQFFPSLFLVIGILIGLKQRTVSLNFNLMGLGGLFLSGLFQGGRTSSHDFMAWWSNVRQAREEEKTIQDQDGEERGLFFKEILMWLYVRKLKKQYDKQMAIRRASEKKISDQEQSMPDDPIEPPGVEDEEIELDPSEMDSMSLSEALKILGGLEPGMNLIDYRRAYREKLSMNPPDDKKALVERAWETVQKEYKK